jgi:hypothetical protein
MKGKIHAAVPKISVRNLQRKVHVNAIGLEKFAH